MRGEETVSCSCGRAERGGYGGGHTGLAAEGTVFAAL